MGESSTSTVTMPPVVVPEALGIFWNQFLVGMQSGSDAAVRSQCTAEGFRSFVSRMGPKAPRAGQWRRLGMALSKLGKIRWQTSTSMTAYGRIGGVARDYSVSFVRTPKGWKLDQWSPNE